MRSKIILQLMLLIACTKLKTVLAAPQINSTEGPATSTEADIDEFAILEELLNETLNLKVGNETQAENINATTSTAVGAVIETAADLSAVKNQFELRLRNLFEPTVLQTQLLNEAIDEAFKSIEQLCGEQAETERKEKALIKPNTETQKEEQPETDPNSSETQRGDQPINEIQYEEQLVADPNKTQKEYQPVADPNSNETQKEYQPLAHPNETQNEDQPDTDPKETQYEYQPVADPNSNETQKEYQPLAHPNETQEFQPLAHPIETQKEDQPDTDPNETQYEDQPVADANAKSCGYQRECVELWMCKNSTINEYGAYIIQYRTFYNEDECKYNQVCCHIADKIKKRIISEQPAKFERCGYRNRNGLQLAIEGQRHNEANFGEFPWMVAILVRDNPLLVYIGGGSILAPNVVLTTAHKVHDRAVERFVVRAGEWDQKTTNEIHDHQESDVQLKIVHANYANRYNNIALLLLKTPFTLSPHISPICLPAANERFDNARCIVTGWGKEAKNSSFYPNILKAIIVPVVPRAKCLAQLRRVTNPIFSIDQSTICAGGEKGIDACHGDGGAPLICPIDGTPNRYAQAGIVGWGIGCGMENVPGGYTNVPHLMSWVTRQLDKLNVDPKFYTA